MFLQVGQFPARIKEKQSSFYCFQVVSRLGDLPPTSECMMGCRWRGVEQLLDRSW